MGIDPNGIVRFWGCSRDRQTHKVKPCFDEFGHTILLQSHAACYEPNLSPLLLNKSDALRKIFVKQGLPPTFQNNGFNFPKIREEFFEILKRHILVLPVSAFCSDAHLTSERTSGRQFNLPC